MLTPSNSNALKATLEFFKNNYSLNLITVSILMLLIFLGMVPGTGMVFMLAYSILSIAVQIYFGRVILNVKSLEEVAQKAKETTLGDYLTQYLHVAAGAFLALFLLVAFIFGILSELNSLASNGNIAGLIGLIFLVLLAMALYTLPAAMGEVIKSDTFQDGFKNVFLILNPKFWKKTFNKEYFILISIWSLVLFFIGFLMMPFSRVLFLIPVVVILGYLTNLYSGAIYLFASEILKKEN